MNDPGLPDLPVNTILPELADILDKSNRAVLVAPPGSGKTTIIPVALINEPWLKEQRILILEPRRLAARNAAHRMASLIGEDPGETIGYTIRFERKVSHKTRVEVVTEGILTRRIQNDPSLRDVGLVIFDEYHERNLQTDLALALTLEAMEALRPDLRILVMSATIDAASVSEFLGFAPVVKTEGTLYPVNIIYTDEPSRDLSTSVVSAIRRAKSETKSDILIFLPGASEQRRVKSKIEDDFTFNDFLIHTLHGSIPYKDQLRAILPDPGGQRKIILSTNIAESSLTIEGVDTVIDSGLARFPMFDPARNLTGLVTGKIALDAADQRAGRAGRLGPGICFRLWHPDENRSRGLITQPEILYSDLSGLALELAVRGSGYDTLKFPDPPPVHNMSRALKTLQSLEAIDSNNRITQTGKIMASIPAQPAVARIIVEGMRRKHLNLACDTGAILSERDPFTDSRRAPGSDIAFRLEALENYRRFGETGESLQGVSPEICRTIDKTSKLYLSVARKIERTMQTGIENQDTNKLNLDEPGDMVGLLVGAAFPDRVSLSRKGKPGHFLLASGKGAQIASTDQLATQELIIAIDLDSSGEISTIRMAAKFSMESLVALYPDRIHPSTMSETDSSGKVKFYRISRFGTLPLQRKQLSNPDPQMLQEALQNSILSNPGLLFPFPDRAKRLCERSEFLRKRNFDLPPMDWESLSEKLGDWLFPFLGGVKSAGDITEQILLSALETRLGENALGLLRLEAPEKITVPSGSSIRINYENNDAVLAVKLQELFGLSDSPRAGGGIPIKLHLLSPAGRPIQVTSDLKGFWERTYPEVRKELRGRYPRHPWPEDPWTAVPTRKTKRKMES